MSIDRFITRTMMSALELVDRPRNFLLDTFFGDEEVFGTKVVDLDFVKGKARKAAYVRRKANPQNVDATGYTTKSMEPPYIKLEIATDADDDLNRSPGEVIYTGGSPESRAAKKITKDTMEMDMMISTAEEYQASQAIFYDSVDIHDEDGNDIVAAISYNRLATHNITLGGTNVWSNAASTPIDDLRDWDQLILEDGQVKATDVIMGKDALKQFLNNTKVQNLLDNRRMFINDEIAMTQRDFGVKWIGNIEGLDIWYYQGYYHDGTNNVQYVPAKYVAMGSRQGSGKRLYGAIRHLKAGTRAAKRFPWTYENDAQDERFVQLHSAPLVFPANPDSFVSAKVLT